MSVKVSTLFDRVDWPRVIKEIYPDFSHATIHVIREIAWRQGDKGRRSAHISQKTWLQHTGMSKSTFHRELRKAINAGVVRLVVRGSNSHKSRANYRVEERALECLPSRLVPSTGQLQEEDNSQDWDTVVPIEELPSLNSGTRLSQVREPKQHKQLPTTTTTYPRIDRLKKLLDPSFRDYITPGKNLDDLLAIEEERDSSFVALAIHLNRQNYTVSYAIGGLVVSFVEEYLGVRQVGERKGWPKWCGDNNCDRDTRRWSEPSYDERGRPYYECPKCHPERAGSRSSTSGDFDFDNTFRKPD